MRYRPVITPPPPEAEVDSPEILEAAAFVESGEEYGAMLDELARYGMEIARAQRDYATARLAAAAADGAALNPAEDPGAAYSKTAQTVRRIIAMRLRLKQDVDKRRAGLIGDRAARRARRARDHETAVREVIEMGLSEAFQADLIVPDLDPEAEPCPYEPHEIERREMLEDAEHLLEDLEDLGDWRDRPIGETIARLCAALGMAPDSCVKRGDTWWVRRGPTAHELIQQDKRASRHPSPPGQGPTATPSGWGSVDETPQRC